MKTIHLIIIVFMLCMLPAAAQQRITGIVKEQGSAITLPAAPVVLTDLQKNILFSTETDASGHFVLQLPGSFTKGLISVQYLGFATFEQEISAENLPVNLEVMLVPIANDLGEVVVNARRKAISMKGDKIIYNVEGTGIGNGNNGLETIRLIPGMQLDKDENLLYRGSGNIQVMINGKKSLLSGDALREFIRSLKGSDIESVEIIAQPSARYEAAGTAGIINIVLKKNRSAGIAGSLNSSASYGEYFKSQYGGRLFYNDSLWAISVNGSYYNGRSVNHRHIRQTIASANGERVIDQRNEWLPRTVSGSFNVAAERRLGKRQLLSTEWQFYKTGNRENTFGTTYEYLNNSLQNEVQLTQHFDTPDSRIAGSLFYNFAADSLKTKLDVQANFARYTEQKDGMQQNAYANGAFMNLGGNNKTNYTIANVQSDFNHTFLKKINLEAGGKYSYVKMNYYNRYDTNGHAALFIPDSLLVNDFAYDEKLASAYVQASAEMAKWSVQGGLRTEYYRYSAASRTNGSVNTGEYINMFPSVSVGYKQENHQYQLSYSRRIGRPDYLALNPYYEYMDAYTLQKGNPALKPQYYHSFQLSYIYRSALNLSLYGYLYENGFIQVIDYQQQQNYNITYSANASNGNRFGFSASMPWEPLKWWTMQLSLDASYNKEQSDVQGFTYNGSGFGYDVNLYQNISLKGDWKFTMTGYYSGRATTPNGYSRATYDFSLSAKKSFFEKKLQLAAGCSNILKNSFYNHTTTVNNVTTEWVNRWETRRFYLQLTYYFGSGKSRELKATSLDAETNRM